MADKIPLQEGQLLLTPKVENYWLEVDSLNQLFEVREEREQYPPPKRER